MMHEALDAGVSKPVLTNIALVISQPLLIMMVREVLNQCQEVEIRLTAYRAAELATMTGRERVQIIICEPLAAEEIRGLLSPEQRLMIITRGGSAEADQGDMVLDLAAPNWATTLTSLVRAPRVRRAHPTERRRAEGSNNYRLLVPWLTQHDPEAVAALEGGIGSAAACRWTLRMLPRVGQPTTLIFLGLHRLRYEMGNATPLVRTLRSILRTEDVLFRIDERTVAILIPAIDPRAAHNLVTRLSWRLCPKDPTALVMGDAAWTPGQDVEHTIAAAWSTLLAALGATGTSAGSEDID